MNCKPRRARRFTWDFWLYAIPTLLLVVVWGCGEDGGESGSRSSDGYDRRSLAESKNNLKRIGLALHNYHDTFRSFPPGGIYAGSTPHHSWQTMLLPFIDQAPLQRRIDFNRPWTDPKNAPIFKQRIEVYEIPMLSAGTALTGQSEEGFALTHYAANAHVFKRNRGARMRDFIDGTSNTIVAGEVSAGFKPWGDPSNQRDPAKGLTGKPDSFGGPHGDRTLFLFADGRVREIRNAINPQTLRKLALPNDREPINPGEF